MDIYVADIRLSHKLDPETRIHRPYAVLGRNIDEALTNALKASASIAASHASGGWVNPFIVSIKHATSDGFIGLGL